MSIGVVFDHNWERFIGNLEAEPKALHSEIGEVRPERDRAPARQGGRVHVPDGPLASGFREVGASLLAQVPVDSLHPDYLVHIQSGGSQAGLTEAEVLDLTSVVIGHFQNDAWYDVFVQIGCLGGKHHRVLTERGWKPIRAIREGERVYTAAGRFKPVTGVVVSGAANLPMMSVRTANGMKVNATRHIPFIRVPGGSRFKTCGLAKKSPSSPMTPCALTAACYCGRTGKSDSVRGHVRIGRSRASRKMREVCRCGRVMMVHPSSARKHCSRACYETWIREERHVRHSPETIAKIAAAHVGKLTGRANPMFGRKTAGRGDSARISGT